MGKKAFRNGAAEPSRVTAAPEAAPVSDTPPENAKPQAQRFRSRYATVRLAPDAAMRQGRVATLAWEALGDRDAMIAFLNTHDVTLGGRPIDLAVASDAGFAAVAARLAGQSAGTTG